MKKSVSTSPKQKEKRDSVKIFLEQVGENIRQARIRKGLTLAELGADIGLDKSNMFKIENGKNVTLVTLAKIAAFLDIAPVKLLSQTQDIIMEEAETYKRKTS